MSLFRGVFLGSLSCLATILLRESDLVALLKLCCGCLCSLCLPHEANGWLLHFLDILIFFFFLY